MMKLSRLFTIALTILLFPLLVDAQNGGGNNQQEFIESLYDEIPLAERLDERPADLHQQFSQNPLGLPADKNEWMMNLFLEAFTSDTLRAYAQNKLLDQYESVPAQQVSEWLSSQNTREVLQAEREFYSLQGMRKRIVHQYEMDQDPPSESREQLVDRLIRNRAAIESEVESQLILFRALITAFGELSEQRSFTEAQIDGFVDNYRGQLQMQVERELPRQYMLMYYDLDSDALGRYADFYDTEAGGWLSRTTSESIQSAYQQATDRFLESISNE